MNNQNSFHHHQAVFLWTLLLTFLLCQPMELCAQKKEITAAKEMVKKNNNLERAEQSMQNLLKDSSNRTNKKIWSILFDAQKKQYDQGNEKIYLKQQYDTATLFNVASRMFRQMEAYDSIEAQPDKKGQVKFSMRKDHASMLSHLRPNLYNGGLYFIAKKKYAEAYQLFDQYIDAANQPLFSAYHYQEKDTLLPEAAYWAVYCAYKMQDSPKTLHHTYLALKDTAHYEMMLQYLSETYRRDGDTLRYVSTLTEGSERYPLSIFFYSHLIEYYSAEAEWDNALKLTDRVLKEDSTNEVFLLTKSTVLLNTGDYAQSFAISKSLIQRNDSLAEAYLNAGLAKFNEGVMLDKNVQTTAKRRNQILSYYKEALPYLETFRKLRPEQKDKWALPLYTIYLNLNMGKEFDEVDKLMKK